ncbi:hypothetical protein [Paraburkholderia lacunae]|uniref:OmpA-like domain-containing protein n=1 Tax=Paraburkholderia lacunae TaxID=2211104 RepID=A0A370MW02_9BURK|nr:hypothetical protein [Paraburkholderia lacunae]RDJ97551.1 hypothetical protein DLM46_37195 [Paraburkholderia lacunae]
MFPLFAASALTLAQIAFGNAQAGTVMEFTQARLPLNSVDIPNAARLKIADMVLEARKWPDVQIRGIIEANAYVRETNPQALIEKRAAVLKAYLLQLGIKEENFWVEPHVLTEEMARNSKGELDIHQIGVTLVPICQGGCARLCHDPRVTPTSKAIVN